MVVTDHQRHHNKNYAFLRNGYSRLFSNISICGSGKRVSTSYSTPMIVFVAYLPVQSLPINNLIFVAKGLLGRLTLQCHSAECVKILDMWLASLAVARKYIQKGVCVWK